MPMSYFNVIELVFAMNGYYIRNQKKQKYKQRFCIDLEKGDY